MFAGRRLIFAHLTAMRFTQIKPLMFAESFLTVTLSDLFTDWYAIRFVEVLVAPMACLCRASYTNEVIRRSDVNQTEWVVMYASQCNPDSPVLSGAGCTTGRPTRSQVQH